MKNRFKKGFKLSLATCICFILFIGEISFAQDWQYWGYDLKNTRTTSSIGPQTNKLSWQYGMGRCNTFTSALIVSKNTGYITDDMGNLYAIDLLNPKRTKWVYQIDQKYYYHRPSPVVNGDMVYVQSDDKIYGISSETGLPQKTYEVGAMVLGFTLYDGRLYVVSSENNLIAIEADSGGTKWKVKLLGEYGIPCYLAIDAGRNTIYAAGSSYLCAVDLINGASRCYYEFPAENHPIDESTKQGGGYYSMSTAPAIAEDGIIYAGHYDKMWAIHPDGTLKWAFIAKNPICASPAISGDTVYFGDMSGIFYALNRNDAQVKWIYETQAPVFGAAVIGGDGICYFKSGDANIYALSPDGNIKWVYGTTEHWELFSELTLANGQLFACVYNGILTFGDIPSEKPDKQEESEGHSEGFSVIKPLHIF
ncbi:MAG: PQQ-binding-like beta-propeller repeat protein [bacterium]